jgi:hypothetical protein
MDDNESLFELGVDHINSQELLDTAGWQKMFGVVLLIIIGLVLLVFLLAWNKAAAMIGEVVGTNGSQAAMVVVAGILLLAAAVLGTLAWFLIRGAGRIKTAIRTKDQLLFNGGLGDLKTFFIIYGVISILSLLGNLVTLF